MQKNPEIKNTSYSFDQFRVNFHKVCNYVPFFSSVSNLIALVQKNLYVPKMDDESLSGSDYYTYLKAQNFNQDWHLFIPIVNTIFCVIQKQSVNSPNQIQISELPFIDTTIESKEIVHEDILIDTPDDILFETIENVSTFFDNNKMKLFKNLMNSIIYEKDSMTAEKKAKKEEFLSKIAKEMITVDGDEHFKTAIHKQINELVSVKPGRILIKALAKTHQKITIILGEGNYNPSDKKIAVSLDEQKYETLNRSHEYAIFKKPNFVVLAHELIHLFHHAIDPIEFDYSLRSSKNIFNEMDSLEEQYTITGFNANLLSEKSQLEKSDILCENAFLTALGLPLRINHRNIRQYKPYQKIQANPDFYKNSENFLFPWLERELTAIRSIPKGKNNKLIADFMTKNPESISLNLDELKGKPDLILALISLDVEILYNFPELCENKEFMLQAFYTHPDAYMYMDEKLFTDKDFVIQIFYGTEYKKQFCGHQSIIDEIFPLLSASMQEDPEIRTFISNDSI